MRFFGGFGLGLVASWGLAAGGDPEVVRTRRLELVGPDGRVVGRLAARSDGAELVLGGEAQASLVTERGLAALNLVGSEGLARVLAGDDAALSLHGGEAGEALHLWADDAGCGVRGP